MDDDVETDEEILALNVSSVLNTLNESIQEFTVDKKGKKTNKKFRKTLVRNYENKELYSGKIIEIDY